MVVYKGAAMRKKTGEVKREGWGGLHFFVLFFVAQVSTFFMYEINTYGYFIIITLHY